ncbi:MAG: hypothetical protein AAF745_19600, partial [Planctomycetota bacterium]
MMWRVSISGALLCVVCTTSSAQFYGPFGFGVPIVPGPVIATPFGPAIGPPLPYRARRFGYVTPSVSSRVAVDAYGGVQIDTPGFKMNLPGVAPVVVGPAVTTEITPNLEPMSAGVPDVQTRIKIREAVDRLTRALSGHSSETVWLDYLQPQRIAMLLDQLELATSPDEQAQYQSQLAMLGRNFAGVLANPELAWITRLDGFQTVAAGLAGFGARGDVSVPSSDAAQDAASAPAAIDDASESA